jgi:hypothetical protein
MVPPLLLFLKDSREVRLFGTVAELESAVEAADVMNGEYEAFDSSGRRLSLRVDERQCPRAAAGERAEEDMRQLILSYYSENKELFLHDMPLSSLVYALKILYNCKKR